MVAIVLTLLFIVMPFVELVVAIEVADRIGVVNTIVLLLGISIAGGFVVRHQGLATLRRIRASLATGVLPGPDLLNGLVILLAGLLLVVPGFVGDAVAVLLLLPPTRHLVRAGLRRFFVGRIAIREVRFRRGSGPGGTVETDAADPPPRHPPELPPPS